MGPATSSTVAQLTLGGESLSGSDVLLEVGLHSLGGGRGLLELELNESHGKGLFVSSSCSRCSRRWTYTLVTDGLLLGLSLSGLLDLLLLLP